MPLTIFKADRLEGFGRHCCVVLNMKHWFGLWLKRRRNDRRDGDNYTSHQSPRSPTRDLKMQCGVDLPMELWIEIAILAASTSQEAYRTFTLVSSEIRSIVEKEALPNLPIRLESTAKIISFHSLLFTRPELAERIRHLWLRGARSKQKPKQGYSEPTASTWRQFKASAFEQLRIIYFCTKLVSLACSFPVMFLCFRFTRDVFFKHDQLKELTLFENWNLWSCFSLDPPSDGPHLFLQLTHLTIIDSVAPHFPVSLFPSLRSFSAEIGPASPNAAAEAFKAKDVLTIPLPQTITQFPKNVDISLLLVDRTEMGVKKVISEDDRLWLMRVGTPRYFQWWSARIQGGPDVWSTS